MRNDFISKAEVIRLIDKYGYVNCLNRKDFEANNRVDKVRQKIVEMSISYDLENVISKLEDLEKFNNDKEDYPFTEGYACAIDNAIEIIKSGLNATDKKNGG